MRERHDRIDRLLHRARRRPREPRREHRRHHVLALCRPTSVSARASTAPRPRQADAGPRRRRRRRRLRRPAPSRTRARAPGARRARSTSPRRRGSGPPSRPRSARRRAGALGAIVGEARVAVEVVVGDVEETRDPRAEAVAPIRAGSSRPRRPRRPDAAARAVDQRRAEIAADEDAAVRRPAACAEQRRRRALAVGAGDREQRDIRGAATASSISLRPGCRAPRASASSGASAGTPGLGTTSSMPSSTPAIVGPEPQLDVAPAPRGRAERRSRSPVDHAHARAARREQRARPPCARPTRNAESPARGVPATIAHRSFSVD